MVDTVTPVPAKKRTNVPEHILAAALLVPINVVQALWALWASIYAGKAGRAPVLSSARIQVISIAVAAYSADECARAIIGTQYSSWHMGDNPAQKQYTSIELILRHGENWRIAKFIKLFEENKTEGLGILAQYDNILAQYNE